MIKKKQSTLISSDLLLLLFLITLIGYAGKRMNQFILLHKDSYIHELDRTFIDYLHTAQKQLQKTKNVICIKDKNHELIEKKLTTLQQNLSYIEEKYCNNSPSLVLLGPIGTTAIILKERKLAQQLHKIVHEIGNILHNYLKTADHSSYQLFPSIEANLRTNKALIKQLHKK